MVQRWNDVPQAVTAGTQQHVPADTWPLHLTGANRAALVLTPLFWSERDFLYGRSNFYTFILFIDPFCCWNSSWGTISASSSTCFEQLMLPLGYSSRSWFSSLRCFCPCPVKKMLCKSFFFWWPYSAVEVSCYFGFWREGLLLSERWGMGGFVCSGLSVSR